MKKNRRTREIEAGALPRHDKSANRAAPKSLCRSLAPLVLSYVDGSWTESLAGRRVTLGIDDRTAMLTIELAPRNGSGADEIKAFARKRNRVESVQISKRKLRSRLRAMLLAFELPTLSVRLSGAGLEAVYPARVVFGPDAVTLSLG